jgi:hypothetical protein
MGRMITEEDVEELTELLTDSWHQRAPKRLAADFDARFGGGRQT